MVNNKDIAALECDLLGRSSTFKYFRAANCELHLRERNIKHTQDSLASSIARSIERSLKMGNDSIFQCNAQTEG